MRKSWKIRLVLVWLLGLAPLTAWSQSINVLWYTYAEPSSIYIQTIQKLADVVHTIPQSGGLRWKLIFFGPRSPAPAFGAYDVLVIHSGEPQLTGRHYPLLKPDPRKSIVSPDFSGILNNKTAIEAARGERTFITGADADVHTIVGDTGNAPPAGKTERMICNPPLVGPSCWDGALGHLVNAVNWAGSGRGLGIVSLVAAEYPGSHWWRHPNSFLRAELDGFVAYWGYGKKRENDPVIPVPAQGYPLNSALTSKGLGNWRNSFHAGFSHSIPGYTPIVNSTLYANTAVAIATARFASAGTGGPVSAPASSPTRSKRRRRGSARMIKV